MNYDEWLKSVPREITGDPLWKVEAYRLALFAADIGWHDVTKLAADKRTVALSDQLYRALGSVSANISEGYSRSSGKDRVRFYAYALGSARESRGWCYKGRHILGDVVVGHRLRLITQIIRLLLTMIPDQRHDSFSEAVAPYGIEGTDDADAARIQDPFSKWDISPKELPSLLKEIPFTHHASRIKTPTPP